ncbi:MAG: hypothetical protein MUP16_03745 [Sedimentisphaerales bacterium]|nr:hypothetical protein [Sedimentisphaerales bacterium]
MSKADSNKQSNDDVLRAGDIMPPYNLSQAERISAEIERQKHQGHGIPRFDLAEQILAEQRKVSSIKRKAPDRKVEPPQPVRSMQEQIIADIVAKDIKRLIQSKVSI